MATKFEFRVEAAKSGRAKCKHCKESLQKDCARIGVSQVIDPEKADTMDDRARAMAESVKWYHPSKTCFGSFRKTPKWWMENCPEVEEIIGLDGLDEDDQAGIAKIIEDLREGKLSGAKAPKPKGKGKAKAKAKSKAKTKSYSGSDSEEEGKEGSGSASGSESAEESEEEIAEADTRRGSKSQKSRDAADSPGRKRKKPEPVSSEAEMSEEEESPKRRKATPKAAAKKGIEAEYEAETLEEEDVEKVKSEISKLTKKNVVQLKEMLKHNGQLVSGKKDELLCRVAEMTVLGALPKCPECGGGTLKWNRSSGTYSCPGFYDDDHFVRCSWTGDSAERVPWKSL